MLLHDGEAQVVYPKSMSSPLLDLDRDICDQNIGRSEFEVRHNLVDHPLLSMNAIAALADALPPAAVERHQANQPLLVPGGAVDLDPQPPSESVRTMGTNKLWMVLWNLEQIPKYRQLLDDILDGVAPFLPKREGGMGRRETFLFVSAPHAVTPVHFDPEH